MIDDQETRNEEDRMTPDRASVTAEKNEENRITPNRASAAEEKSEENRITPNRASVAEEKSEENRITPNRASVAEEKSEENRITPDRAAVAEEEAARSSDEEQTPAPETATEQEPATQTDEALVEMLETAETRDSEQITVDAEISDVPSPVLSPADTEQSPTVESVIEAVLFATDEPLPEGKLAGIVETTAKQVRQSIEDLNAKYQSHGNAFRIEQIAGGYQMLTQPIYNSWLKKMLRVRSDNKLSPAAMETLAIIAYKQPIIRADIEAIRGVAVGEVIRSLMYKGLVKIAGRAEILGRPMLYGTTKKFLEIFGLNSLKDLPKAEDLKNPDRG